MRLGAERAQRGQLVPLHPARPARRPPTLVLTGSRDRAIPAWATRLFTWWSGLPSYELRVVPGAGHLLFHDHLDVSVPLVADWLDARLARVGEAPR